MNTAREETWTVNGLAITGLSWGDPGGFPVLALHGWLDNAASFSVIAPLLTGCHVVALDLTGHGRSDHRSADSSYQIWDDLPEVLGVLEALGWSEFDLLGHSRGAIISALLAAAIPERVKGLVLLDALVPEPVAEDEFVVQLRKFLVDKKRLVGRPGRLLESLEDAIASRMEGGLDRHNASLLALRNIDTCDDGYRWRTDPRLRGSSAVKLSHGQIRALLASLTMPTLLLLAEEGFAARRDIAAYSECVPGLVTEWVPGSHHFHMEQGVARLAARILQFFDNQ